MKSWKCSAEVWILSALFALASPGLNAGDLLPPVQTGNLLRMTNGNVRLDYNLNSGRTDFYWQDSMKVAGFYAGVGLGSYITGTMYSQRTWSVTNDTVEIVSTSSSLPLMKQVFVLAQENSFLTRVDLMGSNLQSRWMGPVVMDSVGGVDVGSYNDVRALTVPFDNDSFTYSYNALPINNTASSYEVGAFYDNTTRQGLVVGSVTHDQWKTGVYFQGANNKLNVLNVYGGVTSSDTRDVMPHGLVGGNRISSPTVFVGFGPDWRAVMEAYAEANLAFAPKLPWSGGVPFGWNSWYAHTTSVDEAKAIATSTFIKANLQTNCFNNEGVVFVNLDSFWDNMSDTQLRRFAQTCHTNGQKAGIYWTPFVYWGTAAQGSNYWITGGGNYRWSDLYLRTTGGDVQSVSGGIALDPTHPGTRQLADYYLAFFKARDFDFLKLDFLSHGALEGVHYDPNVTTGIQAYNQGMRHVLERNNGRMFLSQAISPIFPYQYAHSRRIYCDTATSIADTANTMQAVTYGWWMNSRLYQYNDPDLMKFAGGSANENQSRLINCAVAGTVFLNSDDLTSANGQNLARIWLTNTGINEVARAGVSFRPVEGNTGSGPADVFVRQDGTTWYVAVFNYNGWTISKDLNLARLGITGTYTAVDLRNGAISTVMGSVWRVNLGSKQARLFRLGSGVTSAVGPFDLTVCEGGAVTLRTVASGTPPFTFVWRKDGSILNGETASSLTIHRVETSHAGNYAVEVIGSLGSVTNRAVFSIARGPLRWTGLSEDWTSRIAGAWEDRSGTLTLFSGTPDVVLSDSAVGISPVSIVLNESVAPNSIIISNTAKDYLLAGNGGISSGLAFFMKQGSGKFTLATDNSCTGPTIINEGTLQVGNGGTRGSLGSGPVTNNATLAFNRSDTCAFPTFSVAYPALLGSGTLSQIGSGKLVFNHQYVFGIWQGNPTQGLYVGPGAIAETTAYNPVGLVTLNGGTLSSAGGASANYQGWVLSGGVVVVSNLFASVITNNQTFNAFSQVELRDPTVFNISSGSTNGVDLLVSAVLTHSYWEYGDWGTLVKTGPGRMVLNGANFYQGETRVSEGALRLGSTGSIGASGFPVTVQAGARLEGAGTIHRNVYVEPGAVLDPGDDPLSSGTLTINGSLVLGGTTLMQLNKSVARSSDLLRVTNGLSFGGRLVVTNRGPELNVGDTFRLFSKAGSGTFGQVNLPVLLPGLSWTNRLPIDGTIGVIQCDAASLVRIEAKLSGTELLLDWPVDQAGWRLQMQTNASGAGLGTNWTEVPGSMATHHWAVPADSLKGSVFFRLVVP